MFPFKFCRQTCTCPSGVRIRLKVTQMSPGFGFDHGTQPSQGEIPPRVVALDPVKWRPPALLIDRIPAQGEPKLRAAVSIGLDKLEIFAVSDEPVRKRKSGDQNAMVRGFVIIGKPISLVSN